MDNIWGPLSERWLPVSGKSPHNHWSEVVGKSPSPHQPLTPSSSRAAWIKGGHVIFWVEFPLNNPHQINRVLYRFLGRSLGFFLFCIGFPLKICKRSEGSDKREGTLFFTAILTTKIPNSYFSHPGYFICKKMVYGPTQNTYQSHILLDEGLVEYVFWEVFIQFFLQNKRHLQRNVNYQEFKWHVFLFYESFC